VGVLTPFGVIELLHEEIWGLRFYVCLATGFALVLSTANVITGLLISVAIGIIAGIAPAIVAANMEPVDAIRFNQ
ncbi:MAG: hypothetical protein P8H41_05460, partial [Schleiferiaceae bacterium]|nr:hypothetical protein [Schleiferiaceae bacterium]